MEFSGGSGSSFDEVGVGTDATPLGYYLQNVFEMKDRTGSFTPRERGMYGVHYINTTGGDLDQTWTSTDFAAVETAMKALWSSNLSYFSSEVRLAEMRWYPFGPGVDPPTPPARVTDFADIVGTNGGTMIRQVATTVTMRTALRRHWGRIYLPISTGMFQSNGQMTSTDATAICTFAKTALRGAESSQGIVPCIYDRARKQLLGVTAFEVDSIPDIIRRRRARDFGARVVQTS